MVFGLLKGAFGDAQAAASRFNDRETAEAVVAAMVGVAYADGQMEDAEKEKIKKAFAVNPILKQFPQATLVSKFSELSGLCEFDAGDGQDACIKELRDVGVKEGNYDKRKNILRMAIAVAKADAEGMEDAEHAFLLRCCAEMDVAPAEVGI